MSFTDRLQHVIDELDGGNVSAFSRSCGLSNSTIAGYLEGTSTPKIDKVARIAEVKGISLDWLIGGRGEMISSRVGAEQPGSSDEVLSSMMGGPDFAKMLEEAERALMARQDAPFAPGAIPEDAQLIRRALISVAERSGDPKLMSQADYLLSRAFGDAAASARVAERQQTSIDRIRASGHLVRRALHAVDWPTAPLGIFEALKTLAYGYQIAPEDLETALAMIKAEWDHSDRP